MRRLAWVWMAGCFAWIVDALLHAWRHYWAHAGLAFVVAAMFAGAWSFYSRQPER